MNCKCYSLNAVSIAVKNDTTTITVADGALQPIVARCDCPDVNICINTSFVSTTFCTHIAVTDGTSTLNIYKCNQYWRPKLLKCNSVIHTCYKNDPGVLVFKGGSNHG